MSRKPPVDIGALVEELLGLRVFADPCVVRLHYEPGHGRTLVVTGDNASGKSLVARALCQVAHRRHGCEPLLPSMATRCGGGFQAALLHGDESTQSTGELSLRTVLGGIRTAQGRTHPHVLVFDEPDIGLSEPYQAAMGHRLAAFAHELPPATRLLGVVTHSRRLLRPLLALEPHHLRVGDDFGLHSFVHTEPPDLDAEAIETLRATSLARFRALSRLLS